jgi:outer membrane protein assembly factor BamA
MNGVALLWTGLASLFSFPICCGPVLAQTSWKAEHCRTLATASEPSGPKVFIDDLVLDGTTDVAEPVWNQIVSEVKGQTLSGDDWVIELTEIVLRGGLQNQGYFKAEAIAEAKVVSSSPVLQHVVLHTRVRGGPRYTLSGVRFHALCPDEHIAFSPEELRPLVPLHDGDVFSVAKVREGLEALSRYYGSHGYIDFVGVPETEIDEMHQQIALAFSLQEGTQFRLGNIEIVGLNSMLEDELRSKVRPGDILNIQLIKDFYREHKSELPEEVLPEDAAFLRHLKERTADAFFDFRSCSQLHN